MTDTIQDRLRAMPTVYWRATRLEAADYIDKLEADNKRLREHIRILREALFHVVDNGNGCASDHVVVHPQQVIVCRSCFDSYKVANDALDEATGEDDGP